VHVSLPGEKHKTSSHSQGGPQRASSKNPAPYFLGNRQKTEIKNKGREGHQWLMPVILATQETEDQALQNP
jgi:hypothetical protein